MRRGPWIALACLATLAITSADAHADHYDFSVSPNPPNQGQVTTFTLVGPPADDLRVRWNLDVEGGFDEVEGTEVTHVYSDPGPVTVRMRVDEEDGPPENVVKHFVVNAPPTVDFSFFPGDPMAGEAVSFTPVVSDPEGDAVALVWSFGDGSPTDTSASPVHSYATAGTYSAAVTATDEHGAVATATHAISVAPDPGPSPSFEWSPFEPFTGDVVVFTSASTPSQGSIETTEWDLDGDGAFDDAAGPQVLWSFDSPGHKLVQIQVTQTNGLKATAFAHVEVVEPPPPLPPPPPPPPLATTPPAEVVQVPVPDPVVPAAQPSPMRPFPIIRIAGVVLPRGAHIRVLSVRAPRGSRIRVRCRGRGCPVGSLARTSATRLLRLRRFERRLRAGIRLEIFVRQPGKIGKYTRFLIRAGKPPARIDRCLVPGRARPVRCA